MVRTLGDELREVLDQFVQIVNFIKSRPAILRLFEKFCINIYS